jgi:hypothetical protein
LLFDWWFQVDKWLRLLGFFSLSYFRSRCLSSFLQSILHRIAHFLVSGDGYSMPKLSGWLLSSYRPLNNLQVIDAKKIVLSGLEVLLEFLRALDLLYEHILKGDIYPGGCIKCNLLFFFPAINC